MSSLSAVGSGLDIPTLVSQLVAAERQPTENRINNAGAAATMKLSALGSIKSSLSSLQSSLDSLGKSADERAYRATIGEGAGFSATILANTATGSTTAASGSYQVEVVSLATSQKLSSAGFVDGSAPGHGTLSIGWGSQSIDVTINQGASVPDIAAAINSAAGGKGVVATVINATDGQHLVLSAVETGTDGKLRVTSTGGDGGLSAFTWDDTGGNLTENVAASNAVVKVDGFERTSSKNTVTDMIAGVSLTLTKAELGKTVSMKIEPDTSPLKINIQAFVSAYNASVGVLRSSSAFNAESGSSSALTGDSQVRGLQQQLRNLISNNVVDLKAIGVAISKEGTLSFDSVAFDARSASDPTAAATLLGTKGRVFEGFSALIKSNIEGTNGAINQRTDSLNKQIRNLESEFEKLDLRMDNVRMRYTAQFTAMDTLVAQMQSTSNYLTQQLASLSSNNSQ